MNSINKISPNLKRYVPGQFTTIRHKEMNDISEDYSKVTIEGLNSFKSTRRKNSSDSFTENLPININYTPNLEESFAKLKKQLNKSNKLPNSIIKDVISFSNIFKSLSTLTCKITNLTKPERLSLKENNCIFC